MKKHGKTSLCIFLIAASFISYAVFFISKIKDFENLEDREAKVHEHSLIVGTSFAAKEEAALFYDFFSKKAFEYDAVSNFLASSSAADNRSFADWAEYAEFSCVSGLVYFSDDENFCPEPLYDVHEKKIPSLVAGLCNENSLVANIGVSAEEIAEKSASVILQNPNWKTITIYKSDKKNPVFEGKIIESLEKKISSRKVLLYSTSDFGKENQIRKLLQKSVEDNSNILFCLSVEDLNEAAQMAVDLNIAGKIDLMGIFGDKKTMEYLEKNLIAALLKIDYEDFANKACELLFKEIDNVEKCQNYPLKVTVLRGDGK